jgi:hypothetical protein
MTPEAAPGYIRQNFKVLDSMFLNKKTNSHTRFEAFTVVMIQVEVFWVATLYSAVVGYHHFRGSFCPATHSYIWANFLVP